MVFVQTFPVLLMVGIKSTLAFQGNGQSSAAAVCMAASSYPVNNSTLTAAFTTCLYTVRPVSEILKVHGAQKSTEIVTGSSLILIHLCLCQSSIRLPVKIVRSLGKMSAGSMHPLLFGPGGCSGCFCQAGRSHSPSRGCRRQVKSLKITATC